MVLFSVWYFSVKSFDYGIVVSCSYRLQLLSVCCCAECRYVIVGFTYIAYGSSLVLVVLISDASFDVAVCSMDLSGHQIMRNGGLFGILLLLTERYFCQCVIRVAIGSNTDTLRLFLLTDRVSSY